MSLPIPKKLSEDMAAAKFKSNSDPVDKVFDDSVERAMFDDILSSHRRPGSSAAGRSVDNSFNNAMVKRLKEAEQELFNLQKEHMKLKNYTSLLHAENEELKRSVVKGIRSEESDKDVQLARENKALRNQVQDMEQFLSDYGLSWVGTNSNAVRDRDSSYLETNSRQPLEKSKPSPSKAFMKFAEKVDELNAAIRAEPTQIVTDGVSRRAKFVHAAEAVNSIKVSYYRNGLMIKRGPFRYDDSDSYKSFTRDILDGYFPSELQSENPDGVIIDLVDKSHVDYSENALSDGDRMTGFQLLKRLPKQIVRNGEIIDIAGDIADKIGGGLSKQGISTSGNPSKIELTKGFIEPILKSSDTASPNRPKDPVRLNYDSNSRVITPSKQSSSLPPSLKASTSPLSTNIFGGLGHASSSVESTEQLAVVQVKCGNSGPTFVLKMPECSVIMELRKMISDYFAKSSFDISQTPKIELRSAFPPRILTDELTMSEAGLVPNGTIHAKLIN